MISYEEALKIVLESANSTRTESVPLSRASGRALAQDIVSQSMVPPYENSAMDGIAIRAADIERATKDSPVELRLLGVIAAGDVPRHAVEEGGAVRIMTGAQVPPGADTIVPVEEIEYAGENVRVFGPAKRGAHVRPAGGDIKTGDKVFSSGERITPAHVGVLASVGLTHVKVGRPAHVAIVVTGSELSDLPELPEGRIRNSNGPALEAAATEAGAAVMNLGVVPDELEILKRTLLRAMWKAEVIVSSGGVSVGEFDYVKEALKQLGVMLLFDKVAQKPGLPMSFGRLNDKYFFGLPGNPSSALVCFEIYARPLIRKLGGYRDIVRPHAFGRFRNTVTKKPGRAHFARVTATPTPEGYLLEESGAQGSNLLMPMTRGRQLAFLPAEAGKITPEDPVKFWFLDAEGV